MKELKPGGLVTHRAENNNPNFMTLIRNLEHAHVSPNLSLLTSKKPISLGLQKREQLTTGLLLCFWCQERQQTLNF